MFHSLRNPGQPTLRLPPILHSSALHPSLHSSTIRVCHLPVRCPNGSLLPSKPGHFLTSPFTGVCNATIMYERTQLALPNTNCLQIGLPMPSPLPMEREPTPESGPPAIHSTEACSHTNAT